MAHEWSFDGDATIDRRGRSVGYRFPAEGNYTVTLRVVDHEATTDTARLNVTVHNSAPLADAGANLTVTEGERTRLDATNTTDPDGDPLAYEWTQVGGPSVNLSNGNTTEPVFTAPSVDSRTDLRFRLNATDDDAAVGTDVVTVGVEPGSSGGGSSGGGGAPVGGDAPNGDVEVVSRELTDARVPVGTAVRVRVELANYDPFRGLVGLELTANGSVADSVAVAVAASSRRTVTLSAAFDTPGTYELAVGGVPVGRLVVTSASCSTPTTASGSTPTATPMPAGSVGETPTPGPSTGTGSGSGAVAAGAGNVTADPSTTGSDGSGFGVGAALVALALAGLLARRR